MLKKNYKILVICVLVIASVASFLSHKYRAPKRNYSDFHCFYTAGKRILNQENIYVIGDQETSEFRYAPIFAVFMSPLALLDEDAADTAWYIINFCLLIISLVYLKKLGVDQSLEFKSKLIIYSLTILGLIRFIFHNFDSGQSNILMMSSMIIGLYYILRKKEVLGAGILAISIMVKYTPLIFIPYFLLRRKIKLSLLIIAFILIYLALPSLFIGLEDNISYIKGMLPFLTNSSILDKITILTNKNQSLFSMVHRMFSYCVSYFHAPAMPFQSWHLSETKINLIFASIAAILYLAILYNPKKIAANKNIDIVNYALLSICVVLFNLNAWMHNYILLAFAYFIIVYYLIKNGFKDKLVFILLLLSCALNNLASKAILGGTLAYKLSFYSPFTISGLITFLALLKIKFTNEEKSKD